MYRKNGKIIWKTYRYTWHMYLATCWLNYWQQGAICMRSITCKGITKVAFLLHRLSRDFVYVFYFPFGKWKFFTRIPLMPHFASLSPVLLLSEPITTLPHPFPTTLLRPHFLPSDLQLLFIFYFRFCCSFALAPAGLASSYYVGAIASFWKFFSLPFIVFSWNWVTTMVFSACLRIFTSIECCIKRQLPPSPSYLVACCLNKI